MRHQRSSGATLRPWLLAVLLAWLPGSAGLAAEASAGPASQDAGSATPSRADKASDAETGPQGPEGGAAGKPSAETPSEPGVFVPSEEISEDFAVSFPVDI